MVQIEYIHNKSVVLSWPGGLLCFLSAPASTMRSGDAANMLWYPSENPCLLNLFPTNQPFTHQKHDGGANGIRNACFTVAADELLNEDVLQNVTHRKKKIII